MARRKELLAAVASFGGEFVVANAFVSLGSGKVLVSDHPSQASPVERVPRLAPAPTVIPFRRRPYRRGIRLSGGSEDTAGGSGTGDADDGDDKDESNGDESPDGRAPETGPDGRGKEGARLGEWDVEPVESISEDELSGLYSRISAMREREVEIDRVCAYNWRKGTCSHDLLFQAADPIQHLRWVEDHLAFGTDGGGTWIINRQTGFVVNVFEGHSGSVTAFYFDGELLITGGTDKTVRVQRNSQDCLEKEQLGECLHVLEGHADRVTGVARLDGSRLATCSTDGSLRVWDLSSGKTLHEMPLPSPALCLGAAEGYLVVGLMDGRVLALEAKRAEKPPAVILSLDAHNGAVTTLSFPKQDVLLTGGKDGRVKYWDLNDGGPVTGNRYKVGGESYTHVFKGHKAPVTAVQRDEHRVVSASDDGTVSVWDIRSGEELFQIYGHAGGVRSLQFDREQLVTDGTGESLYLHDFTGRRGAPAVIGSDSPSGDGDDDQGGGGGGSSQSDFRIGGAGGGGGRGPGRGKGGGDGDSGGSGGGGDSGSQAR